MVHALEGIRQLLRSNGVLIDIHPVREQAVVEVRSAAGVVFAETAPGYDYDEDLRRAEDALAWAVEHELFLEEKSCDFEVATRAPSVIELRGFMDEAGAFDDGPRDEGTVALREAFYGRVEDVMQSTGRGAAVSYRERARMTRLPRAPRP